MTTNSKFKKTIATALMAAVMTLVLGCDGKVEDLNKFVGGSYDGFLIDFTGGSPDQTFVVATMTKPAANQIIIDTQGNASGSAQKFVFQVSGGTLDLTTSMIPSQNFRMHSISKQCFGTNDNNHWARVCYQPGAEVTLDINDTATGHKYTLAINPNQQARLPKFETPRCYTKTELVSRAINQAFSTRVEFEKVTQARLTAQNSALNLIPHAGLATITNLLTISVGGLIKASADLVPFAFPTRWMKARSDRYSYDSEFNAWLIMKADAGQIAEQLAYSLLQAQQSERVLKQNQAEITELRDQILQREKTGVVQIGASDDITQIINQIDQNVDSIERFDTDARASLSQAAGFMNPDAVTALLTIKEPTTVENPKAVDAKAMYRLAIERARELVQLDDLLQVARSDKTSRIFNFIDPNPDPNGLLGPAYPSYIEIGSSKIREIGDRKQQSQSIILERVSQALNLAKQAQEQWELYYQGQLIAANRIARIETNIRLGISFEVANLVLALQTKVQNDVGLVEAHYLYLIAWSKINRLTYAGPYAGLVRGQNLIPQFEAETGAPSPSP